MKKYYKPQRLEKVIKEIVDKAYGRDGMYVVLEQVNYNYEEHYAIVKFRYGNEGADGMHSFCKNIQFCIYCNKSYDYIKGIIDGIFQSIDLEIGSN